MKKMNIFFVLLLTVCMVLPARAQVHIGVLGGLNLAGINLDEELDNGVVLSERTVFGFGGILGYGFSENVAFQLEPIYLQKGSKARQQGIDSEFKLAYFEVPLMFKYAFDSANDTKFYVKAGPTIGFNLSSKIKVGDGSDSVELDIKDETESVNFGLGFGAGLHFPVVGNKAIFIEVRYSLGLSNINDDQGADEGTIKTRGVQIFTGITFPLGSK